MLPAIHTVSPGNPEACGAKHWQGKAWPPEDPGPLGVAWLGCRAAPAVWAGSSWAPGPDLRWLELRPGRAGFLPSAAQKGSEAASELKRRERSKNSDEAFDRPSAPFSELHIVWAQKCTE